MDHLEADVALSFLSSDEMFAQKLAAALSEHCSVFIYTERQRELAGENGVEKFTSVFGELARVCVILYRQGWGDTQWTRVEQTAIQGRGLKRGWNFLLAISLDGTSPKWLPTTQLWLDWERFGLPAAIAVIERKITEQGGDLLEADAARRAQRVGAQLRIEEERKFFLHSEEGVRAAHAALEALFAHIESQVSTIERDAPQLQIRFWRKDGERAAYVSSPGCGVSFSWHQSYLNVLDHSGLTIRVLAGPIRETYMSQPIVRHRVRAQFTRDDAGHPAWSEESGLTPYQTSKQLAERYLRRVIDHAKDEPEYEQPEEDGEEPYWP